MDEMTPGMIFKLIAQGTEDHTEGEVLRGEVEHWIDSLNGRETYLLRSLIAVILDDDDDGSSFGWITYGKLTGKLEYRHGLNPMTGEPFTKES